jgi:hypothetical protein
MSTTAASSQNFTVSVKFLNGDILNIECTPSITISKLKYIIQKYDESIPVCCQKLIRVDDEKEDPLKVNDNDMFLLVIDDKIKMKFYDDMCTRIYHTHSSSARRGNYNPERRTHKYEAHVLTLNNSYCIKFLYDVTANQYADIDATCLTSYHPDTSEIYHYTENTSWYPSLLKCIQSRTYCITKSHPILNELDTTFKMSRVLNELKKYFYNNEL